MIFRQAQQPGTQLAHRTERSGDVEQRERLHDAAALRLAYRGADIAGAADRDLGEIVVQQARGVGGLQRTAHVERLIGRHERQRHLAAGRERRVLGQPLAHFVELEDG